MTKPKPPACPHPNARWADHLGRWLWPGGFTKAIVSTKCHDWRTMRKARQAGTTSRQIIEAANAVLENRSARSE